MPNVLRLRRSNAPEPNRNSEAIYANAAGELKQVAPDGSETDLGGGGGGGSQPVTPDQISGLALWLDASTLGLADDDPVATWADLSGNGYDATQAAEESQPVYKTSLQNGLAGVTVDENVPQWMDLLTAGDVLRAKDGATVFTVGYVDGALGGVATLYISQNDDPTKLRFSAEPGQFTNQVGIGLDGSGGTLLTSVSQQLFGNTGPGALFVFMGTVDMLHDTVIVSAGAPCGDVQSTAVSPPPYSPFDDTASDLVRLFGDNSNFQSGALFEVVLYDRALNALERRQIFEYLSAKWATV